MSGLHDRMRLSTAATRRALWGLAAGLAVAACLLAFVGWLRVLAPGGRIEAASIGDVDQAAFLALRVLIFDGVYADLAPFGPSWELRVARWLGAAVFAFSAIMALRAIFARSLARFRAWSARDHLIVVGDHPFAQAVVAAAASAGAPRVVWLSAAVEAPHSAGGVIVRPLTGARGGGLDGVGLSSARRVVVALDDDAATQAAALAAAERLGGVSRSERCVEVVAHMQDPWLASHFHHLHGAGGGCVDLLVLCEAMAAAEDAVMRCPPYQLARRRGRSRMCVLIASACARAEALLDALLVLTPTLGLDRPCILMVAEDARDRARILSRRPGLALAADLIFVDAMADIAAAKPAGLEILAAYVAAEGEAAALAVAWDLRRHALAEAVFDAPIYVALRSGGGIAADAPADGACPIRPYGVLADLIGRTGVLVAGAMDAGARAFHAAYLQFQTHGQAAVVDWSSLSEEYRISNRRALRHAPAKLFSAGFEGEAIPGRSWGEGGLPAIRTGEALFRSEAELRALAELEHVRWIADRVVNGWRAPPPGRGRDDRRKLHPHMVPFGELEADVQAQDVAFIRFLDEHLPRAQDGLSRG